MDEQAANPQEALRARTDILFFGYAHEQAKAGAYPKNKLSV